MGAGSQFVCIISPETPLRHPATKCPRAGPDFQVAGVLRLKTAAGADR